jgi:hypothetical protein
MTTLILQQPTTGLRALARLLWTSSRPLALLAGASLALLSVTLLGLAFDPRLITGVPAWLKPFKFAVSTIFYSLTLAWLLSQVQGYRRLVTLAGHLTAWSLVAELAIIVVQVVRGRASHFNLSTSLDMALWNAMAGFIVVVFLMGLVVAGLLARGGRRLAGDAALGAGLRWGVAAALLGMALAFAMTVRPSPAQAATIAGGQMPPAFGAHSVGVEDGGPGLPIVGWSTTGGDLRVAHFVGLHGLQALPLLALGLRRFTRLGEGGRLGLARVGGLGYLTLTALLAWQALRGQALFAPDALTLGALAALALAVSGAAAWVVRRTRLGTPTG